VAANVGSAARAMKNMGLDRLVVVDPPAFDPERARWMAPGCDDVLARMRIVGSLEEALVGVHRVVASTARHRKLDQPVLEPATLAAEALDGPEDLVTAVLFGREDHGLSAEAVQRADAILRIPTPEHASLNLAQAVLLVAHAFFEGARARGLRATGRTVGGRTKKATRALEPRDRRVDVTEIEGAVQEIVQLLAEAGYPAPAEKVSVTARGALQRAQLTERELGALRGMLRRLGPAR
jgi:TrmH family RNA methyltransferase